MCSLLDERPNRCTVSFGSSFFAKPAPTISPQGLSRSMARVGRQGFHRPSRLLHRKQSRRSLRVVIVGLPRSATASARPAGPICHMSSTTTHQLKLAYLTPPLHDASAASPPSPRRKRRRLNRIVFALAIQWKMPASAFAVLSRRCELPRSRILVPKRKRQRASGATVACPRRWGSRPLARLRGTALEDEHGRAVGSRCS
jgi:hypothetical protein